ncbi:DNA cytosine methyltransferase [Paenibacillus wenxiniae]|uniref:Cytosine-specific methyltransferase n=1 Tax=Paenibacillus wenxiniae TaxID=1636843 RepID=A0ABW4RFH9_9BACL
MPYKYKGVSLFTGAGGMDVGFEKAGIQVVWANEIDKDACATFKENHRESFLREGDISHYINELNDLKNIDILFGGPPCQGFSVAGKMDPEDIRSQLIWTFIEAIERLKPQVFVMENVKALGTLEKWKDVRESILKRTSSMGYTCFPFLLNSSHYGVPQKRERVFFIGFLEKKIEYEKMMLRLKQLMEKPTSIRETLAPLGPANTERNPLTCTAKITLASNPIMRKSPYAGMIFNGMGRPLDIDHYANTLPASMGGNKTPIVDEELLYGNAINDWVVEYHSALLNGKIDSKFQQVPNRLRRITIKEAALLQTFPEDYVFKGSKSAIYRQIGNAVPCKLAEIVAKLVISELENEPIIRNQNIDVGQVTFEDFLLI